MLTEGISVKFLCKKYHYYDEIKIITMRIIYISIIFKLLLVNNLFGQCSSCDFSISMPNSGTYNIPNNRTWCLTGSGEFSGTININNNNSSLCISEDVEFTGNLNFNRGTINNYGYVDGLFLNVAGTFNNYGDMLLTGLNVNSGDLNNFNTTFGSIEVTGTVSINSGTDVMLQGGMIIGGNLNVNSGGDLNLDGASVTVGGTLSVNSANSVVGNGSTGGCEGITFGSLNLNNPNAFSGGVDICDADDPSSTPVASGTSQCDCTTLLPVEFISYSTKANYEQKAVEVTWSTAKEENSASFVIERSTNGHDFSPVSNVKSAGTSEVVNSYSFFDTSPVLGTSYYRIKQVDVDGTFTYTNVMVQRYETLDGFNKMHLSIDAEAIQLNFPTYVERGQLEIINSLGQIVDNKMIEVNAFSARLDVPLSGFYVLRFSNRQNTWISKVYIE